MSHQQSGQRSVHSVVEKTPISTAWRLCPRHAKAIAYKQCGKDREAEQWGRTLIELLELACILK